MKIEHVEYLQKTCPNLYRDLWKSPQETCMAFGIDTGDGWFQLIKKLSIDLENLILKIPAFPKFVDLFREFGIVGTISCQVLRLLEACGHKKSGLLLEEKLEGVCNVRRHFRAAQIKEKFGLLRVYLAYSTKEMNKLIAIAEKESAHICDHCGAPGKLRGPGWYFTACDEHWYFTTDDDEHNKPQ
ncbi:MAG TPA: hypothetical protein VI423_02145 [Paenisporosarcina sp.]|nr:hypothetical protein [Paenisporosarcina sp.]